MSSNASSRGRYVAIGKYRILKHIATGGMGAVYRALDEELGREVALKVIPHDLVVRPGVLPRFRREAEIGKKLQHENLVTLYEFGEAAGTYYLAMEFVDGVDLHEYVNRHGALTGEQSRHLMIQAARALEYAHQQGVVHRDIKPSNLLIGTSDGKPCLKLADLGLARETRAEDFRLTSAGCTVGTIDYMSPEQARDSSSADIRSDMYALGCTWFHMLTGKPPFGEGSLTERVFRHREEEPPDIFRSNPSVTLELAAVLLRMLAKDPNDRYQTPTELLDDLERRTVPRIESVPATRWKAEVEPPEPVNRPATRQPTPLPAAVTTSAADEPSSQALSSPEQRQVAARQFEHATAILAHGNRDYAIELLLTCCRLDPGNIFYRQALRQAEKARCQESEPPPWRAWLATLAPRTRMKTAASREQFLKVLEHGEAVLARSPWDVPAQLEMAEAAQELGLRQLAVWLLEEVRLKDAGDMQTNRALARLYEEEGHYAQAMELWHLVLETAPTDVEASRKAQELAARETIRRGQYEQGVGRRVGASRPAS